MKAKLLLLTIFLGSIHELYSKLIPETIESQNILEKPENLIRVSLSRFGAQDNFLKFWKIRLESDLGFLLKVQSSKEKNFHIKEKILLASFDKEGFNIKTANSKRTPLKNLEVAIIPISGSIKIDEVPYCGIIKLMHSPKANKIFVINYLNLEQYLYAVLPLEAMPYWPKEMHKVQAITSRTYAMHHILNARKSRLPFDIKDSNSHQTYKGDKTFKHIREAVDETNGTIIIHNNSPILSMFDICCGGIAPSLSRCKELVEAPYLARKTKCSFCSGHKPCKWQKKISFSELIRTLVADERVEKHLKDAGNLKNISIAKVDEAGIVHRVRVHGSQKNVLISGERFAKAFKPSLQSKCFTIKDLNIEGELTLKGRGFGHLFGLCQYGAYEMVKKGYETSKILSFYFPECKIVKMQKKESDA